MAFFRDDLADREVGSPFPSKDDEELTFIDLRLAVVSGKTVGKGCYGRSQKQKHLSMHSHGNITHTNAHRPIGFGH